MIVGLFSAPQLYRESVTEVEDEQPDYIITLDDKIISMVGAVVICALLGVMAHTLLNTKEIEK